MRKPATTWMPLVTLQDPPEPGDTLAAPTPADAANAGVATRSAASGGRPPIVVIGALEPVGIPIDTQNPAYLSFRSPIQFGDREGQGVPESLETSNAATIHLNQGFALRPSKCEIPLLPEETLRRDRLLDWLNVKIHRRAIFIVAEAGFGKTTLLADFARTTRLRVVWYRLDDDESDPLVFLRYLVAACRRTEPGLFPRSSAVLEDTLTPPTPASVFQTLLSEIESLGSEPTVLVFDDFHYAESVPAIREITETLLTKAPERVTFVFASRRQPRLSVARLRVHEELAELGRDELRFEEAEAEQLFRETYGHPLEPDVVHELMGRTEGWPASLQLVKEAVKRRTPPETRAFIARLDGAEGDLYDYLAEEVISDLPPSLQAFLARTSLLEDVEPGIAAAVAGCSEPETLALIAAAEQHGLLSRAGPLAVRRFHPLVRDFLVARLRTEVGPSGVAELHRTIARLEESRSWRRAANHWAEAGDGSDVCRVLETAAATIIGTGECEIAESFITRFAPPDPNPYFDIICSRVEWARGHSDEAARLASRASRAVASGDRKDAQLAQLEALNAVYRNAKESFDLAVGEPDIARLQIACIDEEHRAIATAVWRQLETARGGSLVAYVEAIERVAEIASRARHHRNEGLAYANLAYAERERGRFTVAAESSCKAIVLLETAGSPDELSYAFVGRAAARAHLGDWSAALTDMESALKASQTPDTIVTCAEIHTLYGDPRDALRMLDLPPSERPPEQFEILAGIIRARASVQLDSRDMRAELTVAANADLRWTAYRSLVLSTAAFVEAALQDPKAASSAESAMSMAARQGAGLRYSIAALTLAAQKPAPTLNREILSVAGADLAALTAVADLILRRADELDVAASSLVHSAAGIHLERWRSAARRLLDSRPGERAAVAIAGVLESIGEAQDIPRLRALARRGPRTIGRALIRRLAPRVYVEDLGPVTIGIGARQIAGSAIRRKTLALLCYLLTKPRYSTTCDQALDALWPDLDPPTAMNSLNQTVYFLRRVFEPNYAESVSAGYVRHEGELIWLDSDLVSSRSQECSALIETASRDLLAQAPALAGKYIGVFALDFAYEDWASSYRNALHAGYLRVVESAIRQKVDYGEYGDGLDLAQRAIVVDPDAESLQVLLLQLYRLVGAHAAAAEQYERYATFVRTQYGIEPPPFDQL